MFTAIAIDDVQLLPLEDDHTDPLFALIDTNRAHLRQWLGWVDATTGSDAVLKFIIDSRVCHASRTGYDAGIWRDGELVGIIGLDGLDWQDRKTSLGYWLAAPHQGKGIMTRSCKVLIDFCFTRFDLNRVQIRCAPDNARSRAIPERLGFIQEGILRQSTWLHDRFVDQVVYGLLRTEWNGV